MISHVYNDPGGLGSLIQTWASAREGDSSIRLDDIRQRIKQNECQEAEAGKCSSLMCNKWTKREYQLDIMTMNNR